MTVRLLLPARRALASLAAFAVALGFISTAAALTTVDTTCMNKAVTERTKLLKDAYKNYSEDMIDSTERLQTDETSTIGYGDITLRQSEIQRMYNNYTREITEHSRDLSARLSDAWSSFEKSRSLCNVSALPGTVNPVYYPQNYGTSTYGNYPYGNYPYGGSYSSYGYGSYNSYYPYDAYDYDSYNRYRYGDALYTRYHGAAACPQRPLAAPPPGCGYRYGTDSSGCPTYMPFCSNTQSSTASCTCSNSYSPVCGRDGRTYFNACYALCLGGKVQYQGACQY